MISVQLNVLLPVKMVAGVWLRMSAHAQADGQDHNVLKVPGRSKWWNQHTPYYIVHTAVCDPACLNGGRCVAPDQCECAEGWTGKYCQIREHNTFCNPVTACMNHMLCFVAVCNPPCQNGGRCVAPGRCECTSGSWSGHLCQNRKHWLIN